MATLTVDRRAGKVVGYNIQWCENRRRYTIYLSSRTYRRRLQGIGGNVGLLSEERDDCPRIRNGGQSSRWLGLAVCDVHRS